MKTTVRMTFTLTVLTVMALRAQAAPQVDLQFRPTPADKQTVRVTSNLSMSRQIDSRQSEIMNTRTITLAIEPGETTADGTVPARVRFVAIQVRSGTKGRKLSVDYDSTQPPDEREPFALAYSASIGASFPIKVSPQGEIVDIGMDELWLAVADNYIEQIEALMRQRLGDQADQAIEEMFKPFGSREKRIQVTREQLDPLWDKSRIRALLANILVRLPQKPVSEGETWRAPVAFDISMPFEINADYVLKSEENGHCTIAVDGKRSSQDDPIVTHTGPARINMKPAGFCTGTVTVDAKTGLLLSGQTQFEFTGEIQAFDSASQTQAETVQFAMKGTTTVEIVK